MTDVITDFPLDKSQAMPGLDLDSKRQSIHTILEEMGNIRSQVTSSEPVTPELNDQYLSHTAQLADRLQDLLGDIFEDRLSPLITAGQASPELLDYEVLQEQHWKNQAPSFIQALDLATITVLGETWCSYDSKYHIYQAIKLLGVENSAFHIQEKIYSSITPIKKAASFTEPKNSTSGLLSRALGNTYSIEQDDGFTLKVNGSLECLDEILTQARDRGYRNLKIEMGQDTYKRIKKHLPEAKAKFASKTNKSKSPALETIASLSQPVLGSLPEFVQKEISNHIKYDARKASAISKASEIALGASCAAAAWYLSSLTLGAIGTYLVLEGVSRAITQTSGSLLTKLPLLPVEIAHRLTTDNSDRMEVTIPLQQEKVEPKAGSPKTYASFKTLCSLELDASIEENLVWSHANHSRYGIRFAEEIKKSLTIPEIEGVNDFIDKEHRKYTLSNTENIGDYTKYAFVSFSKGERYLAGIITTQPKNKPELLFNSIISTQESVADKIRRLNSEFETEYVHLTRFDAQRKAEEYIIIRGDKNGASNN